MSDLTFTFGTPEHGWMDINISDGDHEISMVISDMPCNSIYTLADILLSLQTGAQTEEVEFSLEPDFALWKFIAKGNDLEIHVFPDSDRDKSSVFTGEHQKVIHHLYNALRDLESLHCWKEPDARSNIWSWEFPSQKLNQLRIENYE